MDKREAIYTYETEYIAAHGGVAPTPSDVARAMDLPLDAVYRYLRDLVIDGRLYFRVKGKYWSIFPVQKAEEQK